MHPQEVGWAHQTHLLRLQCSSQAPENRTLAEGPPVAAAAAAAADAAAAAAAAAGMCHGGPSMDL